MQEDPIKIPTKKKAKDNSHKEIWNVCRKTFLDSIERIKNKSSSKEVFTDGV